MSEVKIPTNAEEAAAMALVGMSWLENNAPEKLTELHREIRAEAGAKGWLASAKEYGAFYIYQEEVEKEANQYADNIRKGEVK